MLEFISRNKDMLFHYLQLYNFGETVSIVFWEESWKPDSFYDKIVKNKKMGFHTLCLLGMYEAESELGMFEIVGVSFL